MASSSNPIQELEARYRVESQSEKLKRKTKEAPFMAVGNWNLFLILIS